jgi:hypothetical protein
MKKKKKVKKKLYEIFWSIPAILTIVLQIFCISVVGWLIYISGFWKVIVATGMFAVFVGVGLLILAIALLFFGTSWTWFAKTSFGSWFNKKTSVGTKIILMATFAMLLITTYKIYNTKLIPFNPSKIICELSVQQIPEDYDSKSEQFKKNYPIINFPKVINLKFKYSGFVEVSTAKDFFASGKWDFEIRKNSSGHISYEFKVPIYIINKIPYFGLCLDGTLCEGITFMIDGEDQILDVDNGEKINFQRTMMIFYMMDYGDSSYNCWESKI